MDAKIVNEYGTITIDSEVLARMAGLAAMDCYGIVGMAAKSVKDGIFQLLKAESLTKGIKLSINDNKISIDFHIIVEYGTNISVIANNVINTVKYTLEDAVGLEVEQINVFVEGVRVDRIWGGKTGGL